ncbi:CRISPR-associated protein Cmr6 [Marinitoga litoralis]|nr:type III-B CRISPR module RAMP protein Cmr6 [Marinitoga litoralis]MBM7560011.1 CRISPR-associated protein Cmr6 [Marinitoga litoralis]
MKHFIHKPNEIKNSSLYYDKFVFSEKRIMEKDNNTVNEIKKILNNDTKDNNIRKNMNRLRNINTLFILNDTKDIRDLASGKKDQVLEKQIKQRYKNILKDLVIKDLSKKIELTKNIRHNMINSLKNRYDIISYKIYTKTPFLVGAGIPSIDEIGFYWSRNLGIPIIPGTTIKGAFRKFLESKKSNFIKEIFGEEDKKGCVSFLDAIPIKDIELGIEYQTPHFQKYYNENQPPNDVYNPVPLNFLSVFKGNFRVDIIIERNNNKITEEIQNNFKNFIEFYGLGAKTSMGYGRFKINGQL